MTVAENIHQYVQKLPDFLQLEVLDFVKYLLFKREQELLHQQDDGLAWSNLSITLAMRDMEDEDIPNYTIEDLKETFG
jgi:hypothetical protein